MGCSWLVNVENEDRLRNTLERNLCKENNQGKGKKEEIKNKEMLVRRRKNQRGKTTKKTGENIERGQNNNIRKKEKDGEKEYRKERNAEKSH